MTENGKIKPRILLSASAKKNYYIDAVLAAGGGKIFSYFVSLCQK